MTDHETCSNCTNNYPEKDMIWFEGEWLCKQCAMDLKV